MISEQSGLERHDTIGSYRSVHFTSEAVSVETWVHLDNPDTGQLDN